VLHEDREVVRLGEGVFRNGVLDPSAMEHTVRVLRRFTRRRRLTEPPGSRSRTSALRDANNAGPSCSGCRPLPDGASRLSAVWKKAPHSPRRHGEHRIAAGRVLLIDLAAEAANLSSPTKVRSSVSIACSRSRPLTRSFSARSSTETSSTRCAPTSARRSAAFAASSPNTKSISRRHLRNPAALSELWSVSQTTSVSAVPRPRSCALPQTLRLNVEQRRALTGIGPRRAEIIVAGAHVFAELFTELELTSSVTCLSACETEFSPRWLPTLKTLACVHNWRTSVRIRS